MAAKKKITKGRKKARKGAAKTVSKEAKVFVTATFNNTLVNFTDRDGNTICWGSTGKAGFKGARKSTPYAATTAVQRVAQEAVSRGIKDVEIYIKGPGPGRDAAIRAIKAAGMRIHQIADVTPVPHNGPRPPKPRRV
jgi:small subunit ribosomal protein S11